MRFTGSDGSVEVITGCMFSGRSDELQRRVRHAIAANHPVLVFAPRPRPGQRPHEPVMLRSGEHVPVQYVESAQGILEHVSTGPAVVCIDEAHFFTSDIQSVVRALAANGIRVICSGLDTDFRGEVFGAMGVLLAEADHVTKLTALCVQCGAVATRTQRLVNGRPVDAAAPTIHTTDDAVYQPRCRSCHLVPDALHT